MLVPMVLSHQQKAAGHTSKVSAGEHRVRQESLVVSIRLNLKFLGRKVHLKAIPALWKGGPPREAD